MLERQRFMQAAKGWVWPAPRASADVWSKTHGDSAELPINPHKADSQWPARDVSKDETHHSGIAGISSPDDAVFFAQPMLAR
jgi:hypothetical protein